MRKSLIKDIPKGVTVVIRKRKKLFGLLEYNKKMKFKLIDKQYNEGKYKCTLDHYGVLSEVIFNEKDYLEFKVVEDYTKLHYYFKHANFSKDNRYTIKNFYRMYGRVRAKDLEAGKDCIQINLFLGTMYFVVEKKSEELYDGCLKLNVHYAGTVTYGTEGTEIFVNPNKAFYVYRPNYLYKESESERIIDKL